MTKNSFIFDTNVLISAIIDTDSSAAAALIKAREYGKLVISKEISQEYITVFLREKFNKWVSFENRVNFIVNIITNSVFATITKDLSVCRDNKDNMFLTLAASTKVNAIVSGDKDLLVLHPFNEIPILRPSDFLQFKLPF